ncbi:Xaa-Pro peptidase family protein [Pseudooceanicola sp. CBS1P-1]|uniref:M24 family metallopeptidase n=1 Tax=Pseudooceanicola albus TaxID=2692189 RepID=A0A6L7G0B4_9RHOB|nr:MULTISPECIES: Xaa-Pro peptidase family protein [Pseudooceanicola]MBT9383677.1 Xaa-Pro peptidase family protein [Pseudooceanicola endophyticus]MXN17531.1 M24 family metallopeptidase [Pseudooceanicola albus]
MIPGGFPEAEHRARLAACQRAMAEAGLEALLLTTEPELRYLSGFLTRFWESPTRPWFLVVPVSGDPVAVIPSIGVALMARGWIRDIRSWRSPDYRDDGIGLLAETLRECTGPRAAIGLPSGPETHLRMPMDSYHRLATSLGARRLTGDGGLLRRLRMVKSGAEIERIATACAIAGRAFAEVPALVRPGLSLAEVFRRFQIEGLRQGADWVPYLAGAAAPGGYADVISPATEAPLRAGDVLMLDTGLVHAGYFCDFDRNFSLGSPAPEVARAHARLVEATRAGAEAARPGATVADLFHAMDRIVTGGAGGSDAGRLGHGLGMQLTEAPSLIPEDHTVLEPGMVLTLEPGIALPGGKLMVHEEDIVITETGMCWLTSPAAPEIVQIPA